MSATSQVFPCKICEFIRTPILKNICEQLLLNIIVLVHFYFFVIYHKFFTCISANTYLSNKFCRSILFCENLFQSNWILPLIQYLSIWKLYFIAMNIKVLLKTFLNKGIFGKGIASTHGLIDEA